MVKPPAPSSAKSSVLPVTREHSPTPTLSGSSQVTRDHYQPAAIESQLPQNPAWLAKNVARFKGQALPSGFSSDDLRQVRVLDGIVANNPPHSLESWRAISQRAIHILQSAKINRVVISPEVRARLAADLVASNEVLSLSSEDKAYVFLERAELLQMLGEVEFARRDMAAVFEILEAHASGTFYFSSQTAPLWNRVYEQLSHLYEVAGQHYFAQYVKILQVRAERTQWRDRLENNYRSGGSFADLYQIFERNHRPSVRNRLLADGLEANSPKQMPLDLLALLSTGDDMCLIETQLNDWKKVVADTFIILFQGVVVEEALRAYVELLKKIKDRLKNQNQLNSWAYQIGLNLLETGQVTRLISKLDINKGAGWSDCNNPDAKWFNENHRSLFDALTQNRPTLDGPIQSSELQAIEETDVIPHDQFWQKRKERHLALIRSLVEKWNEMQTCLDRFKPDQALSILTDIFYTLSNADLPQRTQRSMLEKIIAVAQANGWYSIGVRAAIRMEETVLISSLPLATSLLDMANTEDLLSQVREEKTALMLTSTHVLRWYHRAVYHAEKAMRLVNHPNSSFSEEQLTTEIEGHLMIAYQAIRETNFLLERHTVLQTYLPAAFAFQLCWSVVLPKLMELANSQRGRSEAIDTVAGQIAVLYDSAPDLIARRRGRVTNHDMSFQLHVSIQAPIGDVPVQPWEATLLPHQVPSEYPED